VSKTRPNFLSRSWIRNRGRCPRSPRSISRLRACCVIAAIPGARVQATHSILRELLSELLDPLVRRGVHVAARRGEHPGHDEHVRRQLQAESGSLLALFHPPPNGTQYIYEDVRNITSNACPG